MSPFILIPTIAIIITLLAVAYLMGEMKLAQFQLRATISAMGLKYATWPYGETDYGYAIATNSLIPEVHDIILLSYSSKKPELDFHTGYPAAVQKIKGLLDRKFCGHSADFLLFCEARQLPLAQMVNQSMPRWLRSS